MQFAAWSAAVALTVGLCLAPVDRRAGMGMDLLLLQNQDHTPVVLAHAGNESR